MKYLFTFLLFYLVFCTTNALSNTKVCGYYITTKNDTVNVIFLINTVGNSLNFYSSGLIYRSSDNSHKNQILHADTVNKVILFSKDSSKTWVLISKFYTGLHLPKPQKIFVRDRNDDGYLFFGSIGINRFNSYVFQKGSDSLYVLSEFIGFGKHSLSDQMLQYFSDCPEVLADVKKSFLVNEDFPQSLLNIVKKYNQLCGRKME